MNDRPPRYHPPTTPDPAQSPPLRRREQGRSSPQSTATPETTFQATLQAAAPSGPTVASALPRQPFGVTFYYGWVIVACAFATMAIGVNARTAFSLLYPALLAEFGWARGETAGAFAVGFIFSAFLGPIIGMTLNRFGPRLIMPIGSVMMAAGFVGTTYVTEPWMLYPTFGMLVVGGSTILGYIGHSATLPLWFQRRRGLAVGLAFSGVGVGAMTLMPFAAHIIQTQGWREACWTIAVIVVGLLVPLNLIAQRRRPADLGLLPDGDMAPPAGAKARIKEPDGPTVAQALAMPAFWFLALSTFAMLWTWYSIQVHQTQYLLDIGFSADMGALALAAVSALGVIGQINGGWMADRLGREGAWTIGCAGFALCYVLLIIMSNAPSMLLLWLMIIAQGFFGYGLTAVFASAPADLFQGRNYSSIFGVLSVSAALGGGAGPFFTGLLYDLDGNYTRAFTLAIIWSAVSIAAMWLAAPRRARRR